MDRLMKLEFRNLLRSYRNRVGLTQNQLADALGRSRPTISNWERGITSPEDRDVVLAMEAILFLSPVEIDLLLRAIGYHTKYRTVEWTHEQNYQQAGTISPYEEEGQAKEHRQQAALTKAMDERPNRLMHPLFRLYSFQGGNAHKLVNSDGTLFVSNWLGSSLMVIEPKQKAVADVMELDSYEAGELALPNEKSKFGHGAVIRQYPPGDMISAKRKLFVGQVFSDFLLVIDIDSRAIVKRIPVGGEGSLATSRDEQKVYFASNRKDEFYIIDTNTYQFETVPFPAGGHGIGSIFAHPTANTLYLGIQRGGSLGGTSFRGGNSFIAIYDLSARKYVSSIFLAEIQDDRSDDSWPICMTFSPNDDLMYVGMVQSVKGIYIIDTKINLIVGNIAFEPNSNNRHFRWVDPLAQALYGKYLLSVNRNNYELAIVDKGTTQQLAAFPLGGSGNGPNYILVVDNEAIISHSEYDGCRFAHLKSG